eukprot:269631-Hanusia_phi.AAC.2
MSRIQQQMQQQQGFLRLIASLPVSSVKEAKEFRLKSYPGARKSLFVLHPGPPGWQSLNHLPRAMNAGGRQQRDSPEGILRAFFVYRHVAAACRQPSQRCPWHKEDSILSGWRDTISMSSAEVFPRLRCIQSKKRG